MKNFLLGLLIFLAGALSGSAALQLWVPNRTNCAPTTESRWVAETPMMASVARLAAPVSTPTLAATPEPPSPALRELNLLMPVLGVTPAQLVNTFSDARGQGRRHDAIDIMAPLGTAVLAVEDGKVAKLFESKQGGHTIYQFDQPGELAYYYAHLDRYADGLAEGQQVKRGDVIGYVGFSGNANPLAPHLHFAIFLLGPEKHWWQGTAINPYPYLGGR